MRAATPLIIEVRLNEWIMRRDSPHAPYSPGEIARDALACADAGAAIAHYHARHPETGAPSTDLAVYAETIRRIKAERPDVITMPTLGMGITGAAATRVAHVAAMARDDATRPDLGPIDLACASVDAYDPAARRFTRTDVVYVNRTSDWLVCAETMRSAGVRPASICWHVGSIRATRALIEMGVLPTPLWCELVMTEGGILDAHPGTRAGLDAYLAFVPEDAGWQWAVLVNGGDLLPVAREAIARGGHVAIGVGDYAYPELGFPTNAELVARVVRIAEDVGRPVATPAQARALLGL